MQEIQGLEPHGGGLLLKKLRVQLKINTFFQTMGFEPNTAFLKI